MDAAEIRSDWVGQVVEAKFPLLEWLGSSGNNAVFITELHESQKAVIKLIPANSGESDRLVASWEASGFLSHPHLIRILASGQSQIEGISLAYVVMEYAEEVLSQIIPERALTPEEIREMLDPVIDALSYLHTQGFVHGHLKPSNIQVVDNQLKLSTDSVCAIGTTRNQPGQDSYDAPLDNCKTLTPAADVWSLGITVVESLTQYPPDWSESSGHAPVIPESVPEPFSQIARRCLQFDPALRCTVGDVKALLKGNVRPHYEPGQHNHQGDSHKFNKRAPVKIPVLWIFVAFLALLAIIAVMNLRSHMQQSSPPSKSSQQSSSTTAPPPRPPMAEDSARLVEQGAVINRVLPDVSRQAAESIRGTVKVAIRVKVDASGAVSDATLASSGPSKYFAQLAQKSAPSWKFKPAQADGRAVPSVWRLQYQFRRSGIEVTAHEESP